MSTQTTAELDAELAERRGEVLVALARIAETLGKMSGGTSVGDYRAARMACEVAKALLEQHDFKKILDAISRAESVGAILDPTLYRDKIGAMLEDRQVFGAARGFLTTWPARSR